MRLPVMQSVCRSKHRSLQIMRSINMPEILRVCVDYLMRCISFFLLLFFSLHRTQIIISTSQWINSSINTDTNAHGECLSLFIRYMFVSLTTMAEFLREPMGVVGRELRVGLVLNSSELRLSEPSLRPLLMELLSSQLRNKQQGQRKQSDNIHVLCI